MTFKQILDKARENCIPAWRLMVATEVDEYLTLNEIKVDEETFETLCCFVFDWVINTSATSYEITKKLIDLIQDSDYYKFDSENIQYYWDEITKEINQMF